MTIDFSKPVHLKIISNLIIYLIIFKVSVPKHNGEGNGQHAATYRLSTTPTHKLAVCYRIRAAPRKRKKGARGKAECPARPTERDGRAASTPLLKRGCQLHGCPLLACSPSGLATFLENVVIYKQTKRKPPIFSGEFLLIFNSDLYIGV